MSGLLMLCMMLTMAPAKLPNIIPMMSNDTVWGILTEATMISSKTAVAPITAASTCPQPETKAKGSAAVLKVSKATPKLAPEVTPSTSGPASGL